ncbi:MAG: hypothetical protein F4X82_02245 [Candidatus Spechtbacteria bacterium SB0662_bin_43]|uniref:Uncharacterized protein n=1 Tax=Candidatus Spechtbacteria bacterium SB0662_bin_43 TaxID=2604897 RepID=A0A845DAD3_9BACT|nr:hypothetical protein [Candidatus Spechtbacteria bacterium SB0662_bin_43]
MKYKYNGNSYNIGDLIDAIIEDEKYLDRYTKIREEEETRILDKYHSVIEDNTECILIGELLSEGVVSKIKE